MLLPNLHKSLHTGSSGLCSRVPPRAWSPLQLETDCTRDNHLNRCILNSVFMSPTFEGILERILTKQMGAPKTKTAKGNHTGDLAPQRLGCLPACSSQSPLAPGSVAGASGKVIWALYLTESLQPLSCFELLQHQLVCEGACCPLALTSDILSS